MWIKDHLVKYIRSGAFRSERDAVETRLRTDIRRDRYSPKMALALWRRLVDAAATALMESLGKGYPTARVLFPVAMRDAAAELLFSQFENQHELENTKEVVSRVMAINNLCNRSSVVREINYKESKMFASRDIRRIASEIRESKTARKIDAASMDDLMAMAKTFKDYNQKWEKMEKKFEGDDAARDIKKNLQELQKSLNELIEGF
jgi:hypothetical protein